MGLVGSWIGVRTGDSAAILADLGLVETGELGVGAAVRDSIAVIGGWTVVFVQDLDFAVPEAMRRISARGDAVGCRASEIVMYSSAFGYRDGAELWRIDHDPDKGRDHLDLQGAPPAQFAAIRDEALRQQAEEAHEDVDHVFEIPLALTAALCGFRPDEEVAAADAVFRLVAPVRRGKAGERQAAERALHERFTTRIREELFPAAERLGFESILRHPEFQRFYPRRATNVLVRFRAEQADCLEFVWGFSDGAPVAAIEFFVRNGAEPRYGGAGYAHVPPRPLTLMERFTGRRQDPQAAIEQAIDNGLRMLEAVDRHLREGAPHPNLEPADYLDERPDLADANRAVR